MNHYYTAGIYKTTINTGDKTFTFESLHLKSREVKEMHKTMRMFGYPVIKFELVSGICNFGSCKNIEHSYGVCEKHLSLEN